MEKARTNGPIKKRQSEKNFDLSLNLNLFFQPPPLPPPPPPKHETFQRAEEIEKVEPKIAYYCRMYAVEQGLALPDRSPQIDGLLGALLSKLEKDKPQLKPPPPGSDDASYCERFALSVFARADRVDRAGRADKSTSTAFYAASVFMEILNQFGPLAADVAEAQRYAAWKAADIRKALREGRRPVAGPPAGVKGGSGGEVEVGSGDLDLPSPPGAAAAPKPPSSDSPSPSAPPPPPPPPATASPLPPPRFLPGARVLYCHDGHGPGVPGTVAKSLPPEGLGHAFVVALLSGGGRWSRPSTRNCALPGSWGRGCGRARAELERESEESGRRRWRMSQTRGRGRIRKKGHGWSFVVRGRRRNCGAGRRRGPKGPEGQGRAIVVSVDSSCWRPRFTVKLLDGGGEGEGKEITITDKRIASFPAPSSSSSGGSSSSGAPPPKVPKGDPPPFAAAHAPPPPPPPAVVVSAPAATTAAAATGAPPSRSSSTSTFFLFLAVAAADNGGGESRQVRRLVAAVRGRRTGVKFLREALELLTDGERKGGKKK